MGHVGVGCVIQGWSGVKPKRQVTDKTISEFLCNSLLTFYK